ncbi:MAG TPA: MFS transporter, partial [Thermoplasmata archaeon]|nr:MFS transporter [Thermoplasmata archaeon]
VLVARAGDRLGKGVRDPPRDALLADSTPPETRGKAFGFHRSMDTTGAIVGPILAAVLIVLGLTYNMIFLVAAIPAAVASLVVLLVREKRGVPMRRPLLASLSDLPPAVRRYFAVAALFAFGQVTMSLFLLRAGELSGLNPTAMISGVIALYVAFNVVYALLAFEVGRISDRVGRRPMLIAGYLTFAAAAAGFGLLPDPVFLLPLFLVLGASYAFVDGSQRAMVVDLTPADRRGTSLGAYHALIGAAKLPSGILAGVLYASVGPLAAFGLGGVLATLAAVSFVLVLRPTVSK